MNGGNNRRSYAPPGPPIITITRAPPEETESDMETGNLSGQKTNELNDDSATIEMESESQQMIATSSSAVVAAHHPQHESLVGGANQSQRRQLPMDGSRNNNSTRSAAVHQHLALTYYTHHEHLHPVLQQQQQRRTSELPAHQPRSALASSGGSLELPNAVYQVQRWEKWKCKIY